MTEKPDYEHHFYFDNWFPAYTTLWVFHPQTLHFQKLSVEHSLVDAAGHWTRNSPSRTWFLNQNYTRTDTTNARVLPSYAQKNTEVPIGSSNIFFFPTNQQDNKIPETNELLGISVVLPFWHRRERKGFPYWPSTCLHTPYPWLTMYISENPGPTDQNLHLRTRLCRLVWSYLAPSWLLLELPASCWDATTGARSWGNPLLMWRWCRACSRIQLGTPTDYYKKLHKTYFSANPWFCKLMNFHFISIPYAGFLLQKWLCSSAR